MEVGGCGVSWVDMGVISDATGGGEWWDEWRVGRWMIWISEQARGPGEQRVEGNGIRMRRTRNGKSDEEVAQKDLAKQQWRGPNGPNLGQCDLRNIPGLDILGRERGDNGEIERDGVVRGEGEEEQRRWGQSCGEIGNVTRGRRGHGSSGKLANTHGTVGHFGQKEAKKATFLHFVVKLNSVLSRVELHFLISHGMFGFLHVQPSFFSILDFCAFGVDFPAVISALVAFHPAPREDLRIVRHFRWSCW